MQCSELAEFFPTEKWTPRCSVAHSPAGPLNRALQIHHSPSNSPKENISHLLAQRGPLTLKHQHRKKSKMAPQQASPGEGKAVYGWDTGQSTRRPPSSCERTRPHADRGWRRPPFSSKNMHLTSFSKAGPSSAFIHQSRRV